MAKRRRAVITAPSYTVDPGGLPLGTATPCSFQPSQAAAKLPIHSAHATQSDAIHQQGTLQLSGTGHMVLDAAHHPSRPHNDLPSTSQLPQQPTDQVFLVRRPWHVQYVAICPQELEPLARIFLSDLSTAWNSQGCGSHHPAPACSYLRRVGGIAPVPADWSTTTTNNTNHNNASSSPALTDRTTWGAAGLPGRFHEADGGKGPVGGGPVVHPCLGVVSNYAAGVHTAAHNGVPHTGSAAAAGAGTPGVAGAGAGQGTIVQEGSPCAPPGAAAATVQPPPQLQGMETHRWSCNYRSTLAALMTSLAAGTHMPRQQPWLAGTPPVLVVYLISPSDKPETATTCLVEAALQLAPLKHIQTTTPQHQPTPTAHITPVQTPLTTASNPPANTPVLSSNNPSPSPLLAAALPVQGGSEEADMDLDTPEAGQPAGLPPVGGAKAARTESAGAAAAAGASAAAAPIRPPMLPQQAGSGVKTTIVLQVLLPSLLRCTQSSTPVQTALAVHDKVEATCSRASSPGL